MLLQKQFFCKAELLLAKLFALSVKIREISVIRGKRFVLLKIQQLSISSPWGQPPIEWGI
jgi:hypothetical protein